MLKISRMGLGEQVLAGQAVATRTGAKGLAVLALPLATDATPGALAAVAQQRALASEFPLLLADKGVVRGVVHFEAKGCSIWVGAFSARVLDFRCGGRSGGDLSQEEARATCPAPERHRKGAGGLLAKISGSKDSLGSVQD